MPLAPLDDPHRAKMFRFEKKAGRVYGNQSFGADEITFKKIIDALNTRDAGGQT